MTDTPAPTAQRPRKAPSRRRRWLIASGLALFALLELAALTPLMQLDPSIAAGINIGHIAFEVRVHSVSPDSMTYTETDDAGHLLFRYTTNKPDLVNRWYAYVNGEPPLSMFAHCGHTLNEPPPIHHTYSFSWHGAPVETATSGSQGYFCYYYTLNADGMRDPFQYFLSNPHASPSPPAVGHQAIP